MFGHESAFGDAVFGVGFGGEFAFDQFDAGPDAAGVLPASAGSSDPFSKDGAGEDESAFGFGEGAGE